MLFKTEPLAHQRECFDISKDEEFFALLCEAGTGKTKILIDTAVWLKSQDKIDAVVVATTNNVHIKWLDEIKKHCAIEYYACAVKTKQYESIKHLAALPFRNLLFCTFNFQSLLNDENKKFIETLCKTKRVLIVVDESHKIKNCKTKAAKFLHKISDKAAYRRIATGTPTGNQQQFDLYSQFLFLDKGIIGASSYWGFKNTYGNFIPVSCGYRTFNKFVGFKNLNKLTEKIVPYSYVKTKADCLDLPEKTYIEYPVQIKAVQRRAYNDMLRDGVYSMNDYFMSSSSKLTDLMKMQQILSGFILLHEDELKIVEWICPPTSNPKWEAVLDILEDTDGKVIIWSRFRAETKHLTEYINHHFKDERICKKLDGSEPVTKRYQTVNEFQESEYPKYLVANMHCNIEGLDLYAASTAVYLSNSFSWLARSQSEDRIHRIGQDKKCTYIDITVPQSIDQKILRVLKQCKDVTNELYFELVHGDNT